MPTSSLNRAKTLTIMGLAGRNLAKYWVKKSAHGEA